LFESSKTHPYRLRRDDFKKYFVGRGLDVGAGEDVLKIPGVEVKGWDLPDGDAQKLSGVRDDEYDFLYSSHCLEHLVDVEESLQNWFRVVRPAGWLYIVVPDYILYEKMTFPSLYNTDHKNTFSLSLPRFKTGRENHFTNVEISRIAERHSGRLQRFFLEDFNYNYSLDCRLDQTVSDGLAQLVFILQKTPLN